MKRRGKRERESNMVYVNIKRKRHLSITVVGTTEYYYTILLSNEARYESTEKKQADKNCLNTFKSSSVF